MRFVSRVNSIRQDVGSSANFLRNPNRCECVCSADLFSSSPEGSQTEDGRSERLGSGVDNGKSGKTASASLRPSASVNALSIDDELAALQPEFILLPFLHSFIIFTSMQSYQRVFAQKSRGSIMCISAEGC